MAPVHACQGRRACLLHVSLPYSHSNSLTQLLRHLARLRSLPHRWSRRVPVTRPCACVRALCRLPNRRSAVSALRVTIDLPRLARCWNCRRPSTRTRRRRAALAHDSDRQAENRACVERELGEVLRYQRHQSRVVRARRHFAEVDRIACDEQLDAEDPVAAELDSNRVRDALGLCERRRAHRLRLPRFAIVAVDLQVTDRVAERRLAAVTHGEQRNLVVEVNEALDDHRHARAAALLRVLP